LYVSENIEVKTTYITML